MWQTQSVSVGPVRTAHISVSHMSHNPAERKQQTKTEVVNKGSITYQA